MRSSIAFCNSLFADRSGVAASRFVVVAAACVLLLCFAAESCKSHCNGGLQVANLPLAAQFFDFGTIHFLFNFLLKIASKSTFFCFDVEPIAAIWSCQSLQFVEPVCVVLLRFATHCLQIAVEWLPEGSSL